MHIICRISLRLITDDCHENGKRGKPLLSVNDCVAIALSISCMQNDTTEEIRLVRSSIGGITRPGAESIGVALVSREEIIDKCIELVITP